jgi:Uma2 family endonuclease
MTTQIAKPKKKLAAKAVANTSGSTARTGDIIINGSVRIPPWVTDVDAYRRWAFSADFPETGRFSWLGDNLWVEVYSDLLVHLSDTAIAKMRAKAIEPIRRSPSDHAGDILIDELVRIPHWVRDVDSFHRWAFSDEFPEYGRFGFLGGNLWVDLCMEMNSHSQIKTVITIVAGSIVLRETLGFFYADKMLLTNRAIGIAQEPDAMFVSNARFEKGLAVLKEGDRSMELNGAPDMALQVISVSSVKKDMVDALDLYAQAGIAEYWLVDSTIETPELLIMRLVGGKYVKARKHDGWVKSKVFGRSFRLTCKKDAKGISHFNLETK